MKSGTKILLTLMIAVSSISLFASKTAAIEYLSIGGRPTNPNPEIPNSQSWFIYNLEPGEKKEDELTIINTFNENLDLLIYAADGIKSSSGGFAVKQYLETKEKVGAWVRFYPDPIPEEFESLFQDSNESIVEVCSQDIEELEDWCEGKEEVRINVKAKTNDTLKFIFSVPEEVDIGEHTGGIMIQKVQPEDTGVGQGISLTTRVGVRIYQTVPGEIVKELNLLNFSLTKLYKEFDFERIYNRKLPPEEISITTKLENLGNVSIPFTETITVTQEFPNKGEIVKEDREFQVLRDDQFITNYTWFNPRFGKFSIKNRLSFDNVDESSGNIESETITLWIIPWRELVVAGAALTLILLILLIIKLLKKRRYSGKGWENYIVKDGETIKDISEKFDVKWKLLAKTNKLEPPYAIKAGESILVPKKDES